MTLSEQWRILHGFDIYEELINQDDKLYTKYVIGLDPRGLVVITRMKMFNDFSGLWYWEGVEPEYWMPIPESPK